MSNLGVFVCACDKYEWIFPYFIRFARSNLSLDFTFFGETIAPPGFAAFTTGKGPWNERMVKCLNSMSGYTDVIYLQEDFLIKNVDEVALWEAYAFHLKHKAFITKLGVNHEFKVINFPYILSGFPVYRQDPKEEFYLMSHQPVSIYNREFLLSTITEETHNATWHEINGTKIMQKNGTTKVFCIGYKYSPKDKSDIFEIEHAIRNGELLPDAQKMMEEMK